MICTAHKMYVYSGGQIKEDEMGGPGSSVGIATDYGLDGP